MNPKSYCLMRDNTKQGLEYSVKFINNVVVHYFLCVNTIYNLCDSDVLVVFEYQHLLDILPGIRSFHDRQPKHRVQVFLHPCFIFSFSKTFL